MKSYQATLAQLSARSVDKHFDAYADVDWDAPENRIEEDDPRFELSARNVLGATEWYQAQAQPVRSRIGLHMTVQQMKVGLAFENVLSRGLLEFALRRPDGDPAYRYAMHEVVEECQHSMMFGEFIARTGLRAPGLHPVEAWASRWVVGFGRSFPELFFLFVLGGEEPIDYVQQRELRDDSNMHPLIRRITRIHVLEEARHLCFAKAFLRHHVPQLSWARKLFLQVRAPLIFWAMARQMLEPPKAIVRTYRIPDAVVAEAYTNNPVHRHQLGESLENVRALCAELGVIAPWSAAIWRRLGIGLEPGTARQLGAGLSESSKA